MAKVFTDRSVLEAARERISFVFDNFENVSVSVSGGKDSTALAYLALEEAEKRGREIEVFFLDQEAEYASTIEVIEKMMVHPLVRPAWYQVPIRMTNATSYSEEFLSAWGEGEEWMRAKHPLAIQSIQGDYPDRFYPFFKWRETQYPNTAILIGLRTEEALNRFRAVVKNPGYNDVVWSTKTACDSSFRFYPIFDWGLGDVWRYIRDAGVEYNRVYDRMLAAGHSRWKDMRVSNLLHEKAFKCLTSLQEMEPETFDALVQRIHGARVASIYAAEGTIFSVDKRPESFSTWGEFRDYLLATSPIKPEYILRLQKRFAGQEQSEDCYRQQCRQVLLCDWEGSLAPVQHKAEKKRAVLEKWREIL